MKDVAVVAYCRTGIARATRGALNQTHGIPMTAHVLRHAVKRAGIDPAEVEDVVVGCGLPEGATGHNIARNAALEAGFGDAVPGMTVNRYCGSGLSAASIVANRISAGEATIAIAAGVESISLVQFNLNMNGFFYAPLQQRMPVVWGRSLATYTKIGFGDVVLGPGWRVLAGIEGLTGIPLVGRSTAFVFAVVDRMYEHWRHVHEAS